MSNTISDSDLHSRLLKLSKPIEETLRRTKDKVLTKDILSSLLPNNKQEQDLSVKNLALACAILSSSRTSRHELLSWIPESLCVLGESTFHKICKADALLMTLLPELKDVIEKSSVSKDDDDVSASMERLPVGYAVLASHQLQWFVSQVEKSELANVCNLVIPCALTALDHWSPVVKGQGMICFVHLVNNVSEGDLGLYGEVVLDACCQNIVCDDEIWVHVVELSVLLVTKLHHNNPRSTWYERIMNEMLGHLERQPRNKERCIAWLRFIEPLFKALGLYLLAHFRRIFPLLFQWMHSDDAETVLLVLERLETIMRLTWIRNSPVVPRLVDELVSLYKESSMHKDRDEIRHLIIRILMLLRECKSLQFESAWSQYQEDPNISAVSESIRSICS